MKIENFGTNALFQSSTAGLRPPLHADTQRALDEAKQNLAEVLGAVPPSAVKIGGDAVKEVTPKSSGIERPIGQMIDWVDSKQHLAQDTTFDILSGKSDNLHQSILATQEAGVAFTLLLEIRNKLVEGYKDLTRMAL